MLSSLCIKHKRPLLVFGVALVVRLIYLYQAAEGPAFDIPFLDEQRYLQLASALNHAAEPSEALYWQSLLYPRILAVVSALTGSEMLGMRVVQALLDSVTCALVAVLGRKIFGARVGFAAGVIYAFYGPAIFLSSELLATSWETFFGVSLLLLLSRLTRRPSYLSVCLFGVTCALIPLTRALFLPFVLLASIGCLIALKRRLATPPQRFRGLAIGLLFSFLATLAPIAWERHTVTHSFSILPTSGALNLYLGNNPERCSTLQIRGYEWERLIESPFVGKPTPPSERTDSAAAAFFAERVVNYVKADPLGFTQGLGLKAAQLFQSLEIPRNVDVYIYRQWSWLLSVLVWKLGPWGFPFGLLLPFALFGAVQARRQIPWFVWLFLITYLGAVAGVFVAARYLAPVIPVVAILAAAGARSGLEQLHKRVPFQAWGPGLVVAAIGIIISILPSAHCEFTPNYAAEFEHIIGTHYLEKQDWALAKYYFSRALALAPDYAEAHYNFGLVEANSGQPERALQHWRSTLARYPRHAQANQNLGVVSLRLGNDAEAFDALVNAHQEGAINAESFAQIGLQRIQEHRFPVAARFLEHALKLGVRDSKVTIGLSEARAQHPQPRAAPTPSP